ncbi:hypothetical protein B0T25DRAFT_473595 [Lasiosphaeria hispida]|uniref:Nucleoside phosphorylase domain-containing protein n=1 Tax=Lasiosphaeria hispida TaxID=260671 RepID=A0AAJ0MIN6_9PEZI|nr:hypothetical protein B0T25DRAFT_473595 [Lasiosphaeria hispida]
MTSPQRPATRRDFNIAVICALPLEADAVDALFDHYWGDPPYDKAPGDTNAYSVGAIGRYNVVLAHMPSMGKASAATVAANCRASFPNIKLAVVAGVCGAVPSSPDGDEILLGDVIICEGIIQYDFGRQLPERFVRKDTLLDSLGRPSPEIRGLLAKLKSARNRKALQDSLASYLAVIKGKQDLDLAANYPGRASDKLFEAAYRHVGSGTCQECGCNGPLVSRRRLEQNNLQPKIHFGLIASGDTVMKSAEDRDAIAQQEEIVGFEMEGAGVWDSFPCVVVIKGVCDYADSHKTKVWQRYAAATAAACMKAFLDHWVPSVPLLPEQHGPRFLIPYLKNDMFTGRTFLLKKLQQQLFPSASQSRIALFGLGGIGKTQVALEYSYWLRKAHPNVSVFWVHASNAGRFRQAYTSIAQECQIPGHNDPNADLLPLVKMWLEGKNCGRWLMVIDNADDTQVFFSQPVDPEIAGTSGQDGNLGRYLPECAHGAILVTTRNKQTGLRLTQGKPPIEVGKMNEGESSQLLRATLGEVGIIPEELAMLSSRLEHLPLALVQATAFIQENTTTVSDYLRLIDQSDQDLVNLLSEDFETVGRDSETPRAVAETWMLSFEKIQQQNAFAGEILSLISLFDRQAIPLVFLSHYRKQQQRGESGGEIHITKALGILKAFSIIAEDKDHNLDMHRLVQLVTRKWLASKGTMQRFAGQALLAVSQVYPLGEFENRIVCGAYLPHAYAVLKSEDTGSRDERVARALLFHNVARYFQHQGRWKDAEKSQFNALELLKAVQGDGHPDTLTSMNNLAFIYSNQGRWKEAETLGVRAAEISKKVLGDEHPGTLGSMNNLATTYSKQGRWKETETLVVRVVEISKKVLGDEHPGTLASMNNLATTYSNQGRWKEAETLGVWVVEMMKKVLGGEHPDTLASMNNLATTYSKQGRWKEAETLGVRVVEIKKRVLGDEHPGTLASMNNLAITYSNQGRWKEAETLGVWVVEMMKKVLGGEHPDTLGSMNNLETTYSRQGRWKEAETLGVRVVEIRKKVLGDEHPDTLISMDNLAHT